MKRDYDSYDTMTLTHDSCLKKLLTVSYLLTDTDSLSVNVMSVSYVVSVKCQ